jgi:ribosomal protein L7/L12
MTVDDALDALTPTERAAIEALLAQGHRIEAIKELRVALGTGQKEARDIAQELEDRLPRKPS